MLSFKKLGHNTSSVSSPLPVPIQVISLIYNPPIGQWWGKRGWVVRSGARNVVKVRGKLLSCWSVREGWAGGNLLDSAWDIYCIEVPLLSLSTIQPASPLAHINSWDYLIIVIFCLSNKVWMYDCMRVKRWLCIRGLMCLMHKCIRVVVDLSVSDVRGNPESPTRKPQSVKVCNWESNQLQFDV